MANKWVYMFSEGNMTMRNLLGGKGANLAEMTTIGLPVPQGFTITTEACTQYYEDGRKINDEIMGQIMEAIDKMEGITGKKFGDKENPLLVSVRSGARASMPGMMDTILNLGLNEEVVETLAQASGNPRWAWDCYRRFIQMFSDVVMEVGKKYFEELIDKMKEEKGVKQDVDLDADDLKKLAEQFKAEYKAKIGEDFPTDPKVQLMEAVKAVFRSWDNPRANVYRRDNDIPYSWGTAVNVQMMAFGNMGDDCGTGVAFTRDPATGENGLFGEFLTNAQGEDVVAGVRTPMHISEMEEKFPHVNAICQEIKAKYEYADADYMVVVPDGILDIITEGRALHHCAGSSDRYWDRIERRESFVVFLRKTADPFHAYYTLEVEPDGTVRQKRTEYDRQKKDIEQATEFLQKWQRVITARLTESDKALAAESRILREKEFIQLKKDRVIIHTGHLAGRLLADVLMADLMENTDSIQSPVLAAAA